MLRYLLPIAVAAGAIATFAQEPAPPFTVVESGRSFWRLQDAVAAIGQGDGTIAIRAGSYRDCAVQEAGRVAFIATDPGKAVFDGAACEGKATLVLRGTAAKVDGLVFRNIRVADYNGAGIRLEKGTLEVVDSQFRDSQQGILTANDAAGTIRIDRSTFSGLGTCEGDGGCAHSIYVGGYGALSIAHSRFERGQGGHYVKSRAARIDVADSSFDDSNGRKTNYMIDLSAGAIGAIRGNRFVQGRDKENYSAFITVAPESRDNRSAGLIVADNEAAIAPGVERETVFLADWSHEPLKLGANRLGKGIRPFEIRN